MQLEAYRTRLTGHPRTLKPAACNPDASSGKQAADENFPVGSLLISRSLRPAVAAYYAFARSADDIADHPTLAPAEKLRRLHVLEHAINGRAKGNGDDGDRALRNTAQRLGAYLKDHNLSRKHATDLLRAFCNDAVNKRYPDWDSLIQDYCRFSAAPVGRFLLELHGETRATWPAGDALCAALQVINHMQDCGDDARLRNRIYLPQDWVKREGMGEMGEMEGTGRSALLKQRLSPALRRVLDRCAEGVESLLTTAVTLPAQIKNRRLSAEVAVMCRIALRLTRMLKARDPLAERVALSKPAYALCFALGLWDRVKRRP